MNAELIADLKTLCICAVIAYGLVEICKPVLEISRIDKSNPRYALAVRLTALIIGSFVGVFLHPVLNDDVSSIVGGALGACAGALNTVIVAQIKKRIKNTRGLSDESK
jgi:uncharacterized membrane protein required for colicin V production